MGCPFLGDGICLVYPARPFGCRAYGLWSAWHYRRMVEKTLPVKRQVEQAWAALSVTLPRQVTQHRLPYCREVHPVDGAPVSDQMLESIRRGIMNLDEQLGPDSRDFAERFVGDLGFLLAARHLSRNEALKGKVAVVREHLSGGASATLDRFLERVRAALKSGGAAE